MAGNKKPVLVWDNGYWWIVTGTKKENVGRSRRYAEKLLEKRKA